MSAHGCCRLDGKLGDFFWREMQSHTGLLDQGRTHLWSDACILYIAFYQVLDILPDECLIFADGHSAIEADRASYISHTERDAGITTQILDFLVALRRTQDERAIIGKQIPHRG